MVNSSKKVVLAVTGGISAYKTPEIIRRLKKHDLAVQVVVTESALKFVGEATFSALSGESVISSIWDETKNVTHVDQAKNADLIVVAPATADIISDLANTRANNAVSAIILSSQVPVLIFPAMHSQMWMHEGVQKNVQILRERGYLVFDPDTGALTSGDEGIGRLIDPEIIANLIIENLISQKKVRILISAGGTKEFIDPVRYLTNRSSGKQGLALAQVATALGHEVTLVATEHFPGPWKFKQVVSAKEMAEVIEHEADVAQIIIMAAAVSDWSVANMAPDKIKKGGNNLTLELVATKDILTSLSGKKVPNQVLVGFAAETMSNPKDLVNSAIQKLKKKSVDMICANDVTQGAVFGSSFTHLHLIQEHQQRDLGKMTKVQAAVEVIKESINILNAKSA